MINIDRLQVLRKDKQMFQILLMNKDLRVLSKERRDELLNSKQYLDVDPETGKLSLIIDPNLSEKILKDI